MWDSGSRPVWSLYIAAALMLGRRLCWIVYAKCLVVSLFIVCICVVLSPGMHTSASLAGTPDFVTPSWLREISSCNNFSLNNTKIMLCFVLCSHCHCTFRWSCYCWHKCSVFDIKAKLKSFLGEHIWCPLQHDGRCKRWCKTAQLIAAHS